MSDKCVRSKVFLVPGFGSAGLEWRTNTIRSVLEDNNMDTEVINNCNFGTGDIVHNAYKLCDDIWGAQAEYHRVFLLGHSMGGLVARYAAMAHCGRAVDGLVTINTPHKGSIWANMTPKSFEAIAQMRTDSDFLAKLNGSNLFFNDVPALSISCALDYIAWPTKNCVMPGSQHQRFTLHGHSSVLFSRRAANAIMDFFRKQI